MDMPMMKMYFHFRIKEYILFKEWLPNSTTGYIFSCIAIVFIAVVYESIRYARAVAFKHAKENQPCCAADIVRGNGNSTSTHRSVPGAEPPECDCGTNDMQVKHSIFHNSTLAKKNLLNPYHFLQTAMYFIQAYMGYSLMMVAMTYNVPICFSLLLGHVLGFLFLAPLLSFHEHEKVGDCCS